MERVDGIAEPVLTPGNPVRLSKVPPTDEGRVPWLGEHTRGVLASELGLGDEELDRLAAEGVIA